MGKLRESKAFYRDNKKLTYLFTEMGLIRTGIGEKVGQNKEFGFVCYVLDTYQTYSKFAKEVTGHLCEA